MSGTEIFCINCTNCGWSITDWLQHHVGRHNRRDGYILCNICVEKLKELMGNSYLQISAELQEFGQKRAAEIEESNR